MKVDRFENEVLSNVMLKMFQLGYCQINLFL